MKALPLGFSLDWLLNRAGLAHYARIVNVYRLRELAGLSGLLVGAVASGLLQPSIMPTLTGVAALDHVTFASLADPSPWLVLLVSGRAMVLLLVLIARVGRQNS